MLKCQSDFQCGLWFFFEKNHRTGSDDLLHLLSRLSSEKIHIILSSFFQIVQDNFWKQK